MSLGNLMFMADEAGGLARRAFAMNRATLDRLKSELGTEGETAALAALSGLAVFVDDALPDGKIETGPYLTVQARFRLRSKGLPVPALDDLTRDDLIGGSAS